MAWDAHHLVRRPWALFDSNSFHPYPTSLAFGDHLLPEALLVAPLLWATGNAVLAFNVAVVLALSLSALAMFALVRGVSGRPDAAFLAGLAYAFNAFTQSELPRVHVVNLQWWPLALLFLERFAREGRARDARRFTAAFTLQGLSGSYYLLYGALLLPLWLLVAPAAAGRRPSSASLRALLSSFVIAGALALPLLWPYLQHHGQFGYVKELARGADLLTYFEPPGASLLWPGLDLPGAAPELPHFLGFVAPCLALVGAVLALRSTARGQRVLGWLAVVTAVAGGAMALGPAVHAGRVVAPGPFAALNAAIPRTRHGQPREVRRSRRARQRRADRPGRGLSVLGAAEARGDRHPCARRRPAARALELATACSPGAGGGEPAGRIRVRSATVDAAARAPGTVSRAIEDAVGRVSQLLDSTLAPHSRTTRRSRCWTGWAYEPSSSTRTCGTTASARCGSPPESTSRLRLVKTFADQVPARYSALGLGEERVYALDPAPLPSPPCAPADDIPREAWTFASSGIKSADRVRDGDRSTSWFTGRPQKPGDFLEVRLPEPEPLSAVELGISCPFGEFPRYPALFVQDDDGRWARVTFDDGPAERAADPAWPRWSIAELRLFRACR